MVPLKSMFPNKPLFSQVKFNHHRRSQAVSTFRLLAEDSGEDAYELPFGQWWVCGRWRSLPRIQVCDVSAGVTKDTACDWRDGERVGRRGLVVIWDDRQEGFIDDSRRTWGFCGIRKQVGEKELGMKYKRKVWGWSELRTDENINKGMLLWKIEF